jgi:hypothetical protein
MQTASDEDELERARARNLLIRTVREKLKGHGLDIRELAREMVISSPGHPEKGRIYINCATGEVSHRLTVWDYLGYFTGYDSNHHSDDLRVDLNKIIATLGRPGESETQ